ncbi:DNA-binding protein RHL1 isoform X2 [Amaranthus tricolor]|uniref:DNA-binding protein RHL1 isoform X2 n=1 Tax=Amaranthus tricolor TaxID=29722 RepID=UPI0025887AFF|nr:DNA-binding protein RHL1 isoform X2 [Amaranthus tricolor]
MVKKKKSENQLEEESNPEALERKRLKKLAYTTNILSQTPAKGFSPLNPSKTVIKHHGKDILKKSQRKNRYLFSFSGLIAPISGGKIGDLTDLGSKNPILYLDFPMGRMKLFGTIVYPKNRYLTLQFSRGGKNVMCEDCFDTMIVFSDAFWVGKKDENPDEVRMDFPKELYEGEHPEFDFDGGASAGATAMTIKDVKKVFTKSAEEESPVDEMDVESPEKHESQKDVENNTPVRQSGRTVGKKFNFAEVSSGEDSDESFSDMSGEVHEGNSKSSKSGSVDLYPQNQESSVEITESKDAAQPMLPSLSSSVAKESSRILAQSTITTLFKKVEEKNKSRSSKKIAALSNENKQMNTSKSTIKQLKAADKKKTDIISQDKKAEAFKYRILVLCLSSLCEFL